MNRQTSLITLAIIFAVCFAFAYADSQSVPYYNWDCSFRCLHLHGKVAYVVAALCVPAVFIVGLTRKKK